MANTLLVVLLVLLILAVAGPLLVWNVAAGALKVFLWVCLILLVIGLVGAFVGGRRTVSPRY
jgi:hypothetical protein